MNESDEIKNAERYGRILGNAFIKIVKDDSVFLWALLYEFIKTIKIKSPHKAGVK